MAVGDILEMRIITRLDSQVAINIRHWKVVTEVGGGASRAAIAADLDAVINGPYKGVLVNAARYEALDIARIFPLPRTVVEQVTTNAGAGQRSGDPLPGQVAGVCSLRTALAGQKFRGRFYAAFPSELDNTDQHVPSQAYLDALATLCARVRDSRTIPDGAASSTIQPIIWHRLSSTSTDIITDKVRRFWGTQRRRGSFGAEFMLPVG